MPKLSQRQIQGQNSRDKLLDAATRLFHENGYQAVTVNDICEAAQLTKGAFVYPAAGRLPLRAFFNSRKCGRKNASALVSRRHPFFQ